MVLLAAIVALDPSVAGGTSARRVAALDVLFVVDTTGSMAAFDYNGRAPRLDGVRADIRELASGFPGASFSLIRFDSMAHLEVPWTTDAGALETAVGVMRQERAPFSAGSRLDAPLEVIGVQLDAAGERADDARHAVLFYFSDGERRIGGEQQARVVSDQTELLLREGEGDDERFTSFADVAAEIDAGAVFGYGTAQGAPMLEFVGPEELLNIGDPPYVYDHELGAPAISRHDESTLRDIADQLGVPYLHRDEPSSLADLTAPIAADAPSVSVGSGESRQRLYWIPALALLAVVLWQAAATIDELRSTRRLFGSRRQNRRIEPASSGLDRRPERDRPAEEAVA